MNAGSPVMKPSVSTPMTPETTTPTLNTSSSLVGASTEAKIWNFLLKEINNEYGVAGLMGNLRAESSFKSSNLQGAYEKKLSHTDESYTLAVDNGQYTKDQFVYDSAGYGLAQWTYWSRKKALYEYLKEANRSIGDLQGQLEYLIKEIKTYTKVWNTLLNAKTVEEASTSVVLYYEKPASKDSPETQAKRASYGEDVYQKFAKNATPEVEVETSPSVPVVTTTNVRMGHASISENNSANGTAGDTTKKEVCERKWYNKPWDYIAIYPDAAVRERMALAVEAGCANDKIGYSQSGRNTLNAQAKAVSYDLSKITINCNTDCSAFMNVCAVASGSPDVSYGTNGWTTSNMKSKLQKAGYKIVDDPFLVSDAKYCVRGAIYVKASAHTACGLDNGTEYAKTLAAAQVADAGEIKENKTYVGQGIGTATSNSTMNIREKTSTSSYSYGVIKPGAQVEVLEIVEVAGQTWFKIVWTWAEEGYAYTSNATGKYYDYVPKKVMDTLDPQPSAPAEPEEPVKKSVSATQHAKSKSDSVKGKYVVDASSVNVRDGAGTNYKILITIPRGTVVNNYGYYNTVDGIKWLFVKFDYEGITYTAFVSSRYLKKKV